MKKLTRLILWLSLLAIIIFTALSVLGAFYGPQKAKLLFNSIPLTVYFFIFLALLTAGLFAFKSLRKKPALLMIHVGSILILAGAMYGSQKGHLLAEKLFKIKKVPHGYMAIFEGKSENKILAEDLQHVLAELPFDIKLDDFRLEFYQPQKTSKPLLKIETPKADYFQLPAEPDRQISLGPDIGTLKILHTFKNFKINIKDGQKIITDDPNDPLNPTLHVELSAPDGKTYTRYVFENFPGFGESPDDLKLTYTSQRPGQIRDFLSDLVILKNNTEVMRKTIEVNHPLYYAGYHFYQHSYDPENQAYTILSVTSDSGLYAVFTGYFLLALGIIHRCWFRNVIKNSQYKNTKSEANQQ
jgi:hypothetical protein